MGITERRSEDHQTAYLLPGAPNKAPRVGRGLQQQTFAVSSSGGWKAEIQVSAGLAPSEASLLGVQVAVFSLVLCGRPSVRLWVLIYSSCENTSPMKLGATLMTSF